MRPPVRSASSEGYGLPIDCWALGVLIYITLSGYHPFDEDGIADQVREEGGGVA